MLYLFKNKKGISSNMSFNLNNPTINTNSNNNSRIQELAEKMHAYFCNYNHTDSCAFFHEQPNMPVLNSIIWNQPEHSIWYKKAEVIYAKFGEDSFEIIEIVNKSRETW